MALRSSQELAASSKKAKATPSSEGPEPKYPHEIQTSPYPSKLKSKQLPKSKPERPSSWQYRPAAGESWHVVAP